MQNPVQKLTSWGENEQLVRALVLSGSRAQKKGIDEFSDYDISVFANNFSKYETTDLWLSEIGSVWICVHETLPYQDRIIPTRLVIFEGGIKVDFAFYPLEAIHQLAKKALPEEYTNGYQILLDKDNILDTMPKPTFNGFKQEPPTENEYDRIVQEFWFEVYHVAKYLARGDLWSAKFRDRGIKQELLLPMIRWREQARREWDYVTHSQGKRMQEWASEDVWNQLHASFSHFDSADSWRALEATINLFRQISKETAFLLNFSYPNDVDVNISKYLSSINKHELIYQRPKQRPKKSKNIHLPLDPHVT